MNLNWQKGGRIALPVFILLLWAVALPLALEVGQIGYAAGVRIFEAFYTGKRAEPLFEADEAIIAATATQAPLPPPGLKRDLPSRDTFLSLDEGQRADFAAQRRELTMLCDSDGTILKWYASPEPAEVAALAQQARVGASVSSLFPPREGQDALNAVRTASNTVSPLHEYSVPLHGFPQKYACAFAVHALKDPAGASTRVMASVLDSKYEIMSRKYRANIYRSNRFDFLYPQFRTAEFWTNSRGFRSAEVAVPKPPGVCRIICIGGSTTVEGPRNDLTYPSLLERRLREDLQTDRIEVVNCGVDALDTLGAAERAQDYLALEPDLIIDYAFVNDRDAVCHIAARSPLSRGAFLKSWLRRSRFLYARFPSRLLPSPDELTPAIRDFTQAHQRCILAEARKRGTDLALCSIAYPDFPNLPWREAWRYDNRYSNVSWGQIDAPMHVRLVETYNALAREFCRREGLLYIPVQEELKGGMECFADIAHLRVPGIQRKADIVFRHVREYVAARLAKPTNAADRAASEKASGKERVAP